MRVASAYDGKGLSKLIIKWIFTYLNGTESDFRVLSADYTNFTSAGYQYASELLKHEDILKIIVISCSMLYHPNPDPAHYLAVEKYLAGNPAR